MALICVENGPKKGKRFMLSGSADYVVGRDAESSIILKDRLVSRRHFRIGLANEGEKTFFLEDLESANGTFLNGLRIAQKKPLQAGDRIQIGETRLTFLSDGGDPLIGKTISGFEILQCVGRGGMGTVYKARQLSLDRFVALKVLSKHLVADQRFAKLFHREARAAGRINHPSIVQVYDVDTVAIEDEDITFFAMEFMPGGSVEDLINGQGKLDVTRALEITADVARGLQFAEKNGLVHRDIKPGNLMIGETGNVKIVDLGIARQAEEGTKVSQDDGVSGSPHYISPEQALGKEIDTGADIYSLGVSLYHMLAGRPPFLGTSPKEIMIKHVKQAPPPCTEFRPDLSDNVSGLVDRMIQKKRQDRFQDGNELISAVENVLRREQGDDKDESRVLGLPKRLIFTLILLLIFVGAGLATGIIYSELDKRRDDAEKAKKELAGLSETIEENIDNAQLHLELGKLEKARDVLDEVETKLTGRDDFHEAYPETQEEIEKFRRDLGTERKKILAEKYRRKAQENLENILKSWPPDFKTITDLRQLRRCQKELDDFATEFNNTPAGKSAEKQSANVQSVIRSVEKNRRQAQTALTRIEKRAKTLLAFDPPRFREALGLFRSFLTEHAGAPAVETGAKRIESITRNMEAAATRAIEKAQQLGTEKKRTAALRILQGLRTEIEGRALEMVEAKIAEMGS